MIPATLSDRKARLLLRGRWLAWGAVVTPLAAHLSVAIVQPADPELLPLEQIAVHVGEACGCNPNLETI